MSLFKKLIIDESTVVKNTATARFKVMHKFCKEAEYVFLLSGTPLMNGATELYAPLVLLDHPLVAGKGAKAKEAFNKVFTDGFMMRNPHARVAWLQYIYVPKGSKNVRELRYLIQNQFYFLQKEQTGMFKKKTRKVEEVPMSLPWLSEYVKAWDSYWEGVLEHNTLAKAEKMKDLSNIAALENLISQGQCYMVNSKWKARQVVKDIKNGKYGDQRIIIWTIYIDTREQLKKDLTSAGVGWKTFEELDEWKTGNEQVLLGSILANGKGSNVSEASVCLFVDMSFVPPVNIQAECRIDRPQQTRDMTVVYYITQGDDVVDAHVQRINKDKAQKIGKFMKPMTEEEVSAVENSLENLRVKYPKETKILGI